MQGLDEELQSVQSKMALYSLFAEALNYPGQALVGQLKSGDFVDRLLASLARLGQDLPEIIVDTLKNAYSGSSRSGEEVLLELEKDYTRLFFASKPRLAYLFESVYKEGKLYQDSTFEIARLYRDAGLKPSDDFRLPPDHIAVEFEFLAFLCFKELEGSKNGDKEAVEYAKELQHKVVGKHLGPFARNVSERLEKHAGTSFYRTVALAILHHFPPP